LQYLINTSHIFNIRGRDLALGGNVVTVLAVEDSLSALVHLDLGDNAVGGVDANLNSLAVSLISSASLDVDHIFLSVHSGDLALALLEVASGHNNLVILADGKRSHLRIVTKRNFISKLK
jgi:acyl CoA:acetate/3-ketoacid CoA transferase